MGGSLALPQIENDNEDEHDSGPRVMGDHVIRRGSTGSPGSAEPHPTANRERER
jgi:hypothetical protein